MSTLEEIELDATIREDVRTSPSSEPLSDSHQNGMTRAQAWNLYVSHFLSTWNIRTYVSSPIAHIPWSLRANSFVIGICSCERTRILIISDQADHTRLFSQQPRIQTRS